MRIYALHTAWPDQSHDDEFVEHLVCVGDPDALQVCRAILRDSGKEMRALVCLQGDVSMSKELIKQIDRRPRLLDDQRPARTVSFE